MIRAIPATEDFLNRKLRYAFELTTHDGARLMYAHIPDEPFTEGWFTQSEIDSETSRLQYALVELPRDVAAALADAILTETTGIAPSDARALRHDLQHEKERRDKLEDAVLDLLRATPR